MSSFDPFQWIPYFILTIMWSWNDSISFCYLTFRIAWTKCMVTKFYIILSWILRGNKNICYHHDYNIIYMYIRKECHMISIHTYAFFRVFLVFDESGVGTEARVTTQCVLTGLVTPAIVISTLVDIWGNRDYRLKVRTWIYNPGSVQTTKVRVATQCVLTGLVTPAIVISTLVDIWGNRDYGDSR